MPQIEFHILGEAGDDVRIRHACKLIDEAYEHGQRVFVHVSSEADARRMDDTLWTFRDQAFIPHEIVAANSPTHPCIMALIGDATTAPADFADVLINVSTAAPPTLTSFSKVFEVVDADTQHKQQARERYKQYRELGFGLDTKNF